MRQLLIFIFWAGVIVGLVAFETWVVMSLWNWLVPMFWTTAPILTIWQSAGILLLVNIIGKVFFGSKS